MSDLLKGLGIAVGVVLAGVTGAAYGSLLEEGKRAREAHDWETADDRFRAIAPFAELLERHDIAP